MIAKALLTASALVIGGFGATAHAAPREDIVSIRIATADLNLNSQAGARVALARVQQAAQRVCGGQPYPKDLGAVAAYRTCLAVTVDDAVVSVNAPAVAALNSSDKAAKVLVAAAR